MASAEYHMTMFNFVYFFSIAISRIKLGFLFQNLLCFCCILWKVMDVDIQNYERVFG